MILRCEMRCASGCRDLLALFRSASTMGATRHDSRRIELESMEIVVCPFCRTRMSPKADGSCPSCQASLANAPPVPKSTLKCPSCGGGLPFHAVLCVACGYHLKTGVQLATVSGKRVEQTPESAPIHETSVLQPESIQRDANPYSPPLAAASASILPEDDHFRADLTTAAADQAKAIVRDAEMFWLVVLVGIFVCQPSFLIMLPWYSVRWWQWNALHRRFAELRHPNSFSAHANLAERFLAAKWKLVLGTQLSAAVWVGGAVGVLWVLASPSR